MSRHPTHHGWRGALLAAVLCACVLVAGVPALAGPTGPGTCEEYPDLPFCGDDTTDPPPPPPVEDGPDEPRPPDNPGPIPYEHWGPALSTDGDGTTCWTVEIEAVLPEPPDNIDSWTYAEAIGRIADYHQNGELYDVCPSLVVDLIGPVAEAYFAGSGVPDATLRVDPGRAITGLATYLEVEQGPTPDPVTADTPFGQMVLTVNDPEWAVDWGEGAGYEPVDTLGGPYPDGDLRHVYQDTGSYTIRWRTHWTATFRVGDDPPMSLHAVAEEASITVPVDEVQAVVTG